MMRQFINDPIIKMMMFFVLGVLCMEQSSFAANIKKIKQGSNTTLNSTSNSTSNSTAKSISKSKLDSSLNSTSDSSSVSNSTSDSSSNSKVNLQNDNLLNQYYTRFKTSVGVHVASGSFSETSEESGVSYSETGFSLEVAPRDSLYSLNFDYNFKERSTSSGTLRVVNTFREYRAIMMRSFPQFISYDSQGNQILQFSFFAGLGLGSLVPQTQIAVFDSSKKITSQSYLLEAFQAGVNFGLNRGLFLKLFAQATYAAPYPKGMTSSIGLGAGASF